MWDTHFPGRWRHFGGTALFELAGFWSPFLSPALPLSNPQRTPELLQTCPLTPPAPVFVLPGLGGETSRLCRPHPRASSLRLGKELLSPHRPLAKGLPGGQRGFLGLGRGYKSIRRAQAEIERRLPQTGYIIFKRQLSNRKSIYLL